MSRQVLRSVVPVDGVLHVVYLRGPIVHVAARAEDVVEIWYLDDPGAVAVPRQLCVFGTGHPVQDGFDHLGTAVTPSGLLVWHLFDWTGA